MNNRGISEIVRLFTLLVIALALVLIVGSYLYFFSFIDLAFQGDLQADAVNLTNSSDVTFGQVHDAFFSSADYIVIFFLFGEIILIMFAGFINRENTPKIFFMVDFLIILFVYILAVYISNAYETILLTLPYSDVFLSNLPMSSEVLLLLPYISVIVGFVTMILTYSGIPRRREELEVPGI